MFKNSINTVTTGLLLVHLFVLHIFAIKAITNPRRFTWAIKFHVPEKYRLNKSYLVVDHFFADNTKNGRATA